MKKSVLFRTALIMLVLTMVSSCFVGGTFAKYVTSGEGTDSARVAKFGVEITANGETFAEEYYGEAGGNSVALNAGAELTTVVSDDTGVYKDVVAPGTKGNMASMTLSGKPEVDVKVSYVGTFDISDNWTVEGGEFYCPLVIKVNEVSVDGSDYNTASGFEDAVNELINEYTKIYTAGTDLSVDSVKADSLSVSWEWPFSTGDANDAKDTWLGNQAVDNNAATVTLIVKTTVEQID